EITVENTGNVTLYNVSVVDANADSLESSGIDSILPGGRSEEHTSDVQSRGDIVCRLLQDIATVSLDDPDGPQPPDADTVVTNIDNVPSYAFSKVQTEHSFPTRRSSDLEITVENTGNVTLYNVSVVDANADSLESSGIDSILPGG